MVRSGPPTDCPSHCGPEKDWDWWGVRVRQEHYRAQPGAAPSAAGTSAIWRGVVRGDGPADSHRSGDAASSGGRIGFVFQDSTTSLNPTLTVGYQVAESLRIHRGRSKRTARAETIDLLDRVGLPEPARRFGSYPHQLSGGQRQRVAIAMAIACKPKLIIADEPTTALDVSVQGQILSLLSELVSDTDAAVLLITHDLAAAADFCDRIAVMYAGRIVEMAPARVVERGARMPYTQALLDCIPRLDEDLEALAAPVQGSPPNLLALPPGCSFQPRCTAARDECNDGVPELSEFAQGHLARCIGAQAGGWL